jgi:hypothetical protein
MKRLAVTLSILALFACGQGDTGPAGESEVPSGVSATGDEAAMPDTEEPMAIPEPAAVEQEDPRVANCLDLIKQAKYQEALPTCLAAAAIDPDNQQVQDAVATARAEAAKLAGAGEAAEAAEGAAGEAAAQADEAAKGLADKLGQ